MLVAEVIDCQPKIIAKYKRKVRLASGINATGALSTEAMAQGMDCLRMFAGKLKHHQVSSANVDVIATATLRNITNSESFCQQAAKILPVAINIISGEQEAELIYQGMFHTTAGENKRLVIDIGGASTEFIVGDGKQLLYKTSQPIGCVSYLEPFFSSFPYQSGQFDAVKQQVKTTLGNQLAQINAFDCCCAVGASGTVQTLMELLRFRGQNEVITLEFLQQLKAEILQQSCSELKEINGLCCERAPTLATGVAILLALFELLKLTHMNLSGGALREGVLFQLIDDLD